VLTGDFLLLRLKKQQTYFFEIATDSDLIISGKYAIMRKRFVREERGENGNVFESG
jgi:hypothetical protein